MSLESRECDVVVVQFCTFGLVFSRIITPASYTKPDSVVLRRCSSSSTTSGVTRNGTGCNICGSDTIACVVRCKSKLTGFGPGLDRLEEVGDSGNFVHSFFVVLAATESGDDGSAFDGDDDSGRDMTCLLVLVAFTEAVTFPLTGTGGGLISLRDTFE